MGLQDFTGCYNGLQRVPRGFRGLQEVSEC